MLDPASHAGLRAEIARQIKEDRAVLDGLRDDVRPLRSQIQKINPRSTTSLSLVATDGGNNQLRFDPFLIQLVRVVDSSNNEHCLDVISPTMNIAELSNRQFDGSQGPTALGRLMQYLGVSDLSELSPMIPNDRDEVKPENWVQAYRELVEWAILFAVMRENNFATDTLMVFDGFLRSKIFSRGLFQQYRKGIQEAIDRHFDVHKSRIYLVGIAKQSKVFSRYHLAMALEGVMQSPFPCYVEIPRELEEKSYVWRDYAQGDENATEGSGINKFVAGKMFFVKFGNKPKDPIWPIDIFLSQSSEHQTIFSYLLNDAIDGFPVPFYPRSLQKAHENAALVNFDMDILQDMIFNGLRMNLREKVSVLDSFQFQDTNPAANRY